MSDINWRKIKDVKTKWRVVQKHVNEWQRNFENEGSSRYFTENRSTKRKGDREGEVKSINQRGRKGKKFLQLQEFSRKKEEFVEKNPVK